MAAAKLDSKTHLAAVDLQKKTSWTYEECLRLVRTYSPMGIEALVRARKARSGEEARSGELVSLPAAPARKKAAPPSSKAEG